MKTRSPALVQLLERPASERKLGQFWLVEECGEGGYAPVWLAREMYGRTELRLVALKLFGLDEFGADKDDFIEEARVLGNVDHPHVARFYGIVVDEVIGVLGLAMELLAGRSLEQRLASEKILSIDESLSIGIAIASALATVHGAGIVHRDVKPGNIVEDARGMYKLIDFGIATESADDFNEAVAGSIAEIELNHGAADITAPMTGMATGTPGYIDPARSTKRIAASATSDLYALGATLYRCLSGYLPAQIGENSAGMIAWDPQVLSGKTPPSSIASRRPETPNNLATLVDRLVNPRREQRPRGALQVEHELERIRIELGGRKRDLPPEDEGPFRGLRRFEARDRDVFFGRRNEITRAMDLLRGRGLVALVGVSGSGKSSLARAALLPALVEGELAKWPKEWDVVIVEPGRDPWSAITNALRPFIPEAPLLDTEPLVAAMEERANQEGRGLAIFVDQLEELVTTSLPESRDEAAALLAGMGERAISGVRAIVAARSDLLDPLLGLDKLGKTLSNSLCIVESLRAHEWRESVTGALAAYGYEFEDDALEKELFQEIDRTIEAMPLVEFALAEMWNLRDRQEKRLTRAAFEKVGGIEGALELHAEGTVEALSGADAISMDVVRSVLIALTTPEGTRRSQSENELIRIAGDDARRAVSALVHARLLVPVKGGVTVAHEALLTRWSRLRSWIAEARADRLLAEELEHDASRWKQDAESIGVWTGRRLGFARELLRKDEIRLSENAKSFVRGSVRQSRQRYLIIGMSFLAIMGILGFLGFNYFRAERARAQEKEEALAKIDDLMRGNKSAEEKLVATQKLLDELKSGNGSTVNAEPMQSVSAVKSLVSASASAPAPAPPPRVIAVSAPLAKVSEEKVASMGSASATPAATSSTTLTSAPSAQTSGKPPILGISGDNDLEKQPSGN